MKKVAVLALSAIAMCCFEARADQPPLQIARQGFFYVGGQRSPDGAGVVDQMFVEYQEPVQRTAPYPIVMIHGGFQNGTNFLGTPDGREGWAVWFVRHGYGVYVVDHPARGRSNYSPTADGPVGMPTTDFLERIFTAPERHKIWPQASLHTQWPGSGTAGDPVFDQFQASQQASIRDNRREDAITRAAGVALLRKIGPSILLTHSRSGPIGWEIADDAPELVKAIVAVEPSGPPFRDGKPVVMGEPTPAREWGIAYDHLTYDPPVSDPAELHPGREAAADAPDKLACWKSAEARRLTRLANVPVLVVTSEASYHTLYDHCTVAFLREASVPVEWISLSERGIHGNGHMMMIEKNNSDIAALIADWTGQFGK